MPDDHTTGIPNPDTPGHWLVPPWPADASFSDVVRQFLRFRPWRYTNTGHLLAYFEGYRAALETAPASELTQALDQRWREDMRECVTTCATLYREKRTTEINRAKGNHSTLPTVHEQRIL